MGKKGKTISAAQMRKIFALARERGLDDELLHAYVQSITHKESIRELSLKEGIKVIDSLEGKPKVGTASDKQMKYIQGLMMELGWITDIGTPDMERLDRFLQSPRAGINLGSHKWLTRSKASQLIEALKSMVEREKKEKDIAG